MLAAFRPLHGFLLLGFAYGLFQCWYIPYASFSADELWTAFHIYQYTEHLPYRDFLPYKTTLGYYLLTFPFFLSHDILNPLFYVRAEIMGINLILLGLASYWACRIFQPKAVLLTLALLLSSELFLAYSVEIRVDMLTSWLGLLSVMGILSNRPKLAGLALGIGFLVSQKALWFWAAIDFALIIQWSSRKQALLLINLIALITLSIYVLLASYVSSFEVVWRNIFYEAYLQTLSHGYNLIRYVCWQTILQNGPIFLFLWPLTLLGFFINKTPQRLFIFLFSSFLILRLLTYPQPFPYQMVFLAPAFFLLFSDFFSECFALFNKPIPSIHPKLLFWLTAVSIFWILGITTSFGLLRGYYLVALLPLILAFKISKPQLPALGVTFGIIIIFTGLIYPLLHLTTLINLFNGQYQFSMIRLTDQLLKQGGGYTAGTPILYNKDQSIVGLKNLINASVLYIIDPKKTSKNELFASLNITPQTQAEILKDLEKNPPMLYINSYRILELPFSIKHFFHTHYQQYSGSVYIYTPLKSKFPEVPHKANDNWAQMLKLITL